MEETTQTRTPATYGYKMRFLVIILLVVVAGVSYQYGQRKAAAPNAEAMAREKNAQTLLAVGKLIVLPDDPKIVVATVSDVAKLKDKKFFENAQNGDNLVIVPSTNKAILYRAAINKIIDIGPYATTPAPTATSTQQRPKTQP